MRIIALILLLAAPVFAEDETTLTSFGPFTAKLPADMVEGEPDGTTRTFTNEGIRLVVEQGPGVSLDAYEFDANADLKKVPVEVDGIPTEMLVIQEKGQLTMAMKLDAPDSAGYVFGVEANGPCAVEDLEVAERILTHHHQVRLVIPFK